MGRDTWWVIRGVELRNALECAHAGDDPGTVYTELYANTSQAESVDEASAERHRWADVFEKERHEWRQVPQTPEAKTAASILAEVVNCLRLNEPAALQGGERIMCVHDDDES